jgi:hypothetical protein
MKLTNKKINFIGWLLFLASASGFVVSALRSGDLAALIGAALFFVACLVFLIPFFRRMGD